MSNIKDFLSHPAWKEIKEELQNKIDWLEYKILNTYDNEVKYSEQDLMKKQRENLILLRDTPELLLNLN